MRPLKWLLLVLLVVRFVAVSVLANLLVLVARWLFIDLYDSSAERDAAYDAMMGVDVVVAVLIAAGDQLLAYRQRRRQRADPKT